MKAIDLAILASVGNTYNQTRTSLIGDVFSKTLGGKTVLGPRLNSFVDTTTDAAVTPVQVFLTPNYRLFSLSVAAGLITVSLHNIDPLTLAPTYVGKIQFVTPNLAVTTHTVRALKVDDSGGTWKVYVGTVGTVLINAGTFLVNGLTASDFSIVGFPTIFFATGIAQKAVYFLQNPSAIGVSHNLTALAGNYLDLNSNVIGHVNGLATTLQVAKWDTTAAFGTDLAGQTFTVTIATPAVFTSNGHGYANNDQVALYTTNQLPTGFIPSVVGGAQTQYFVRNATANTFELSLTSGGASIAGTGIQSGTHTVRRAFGITGTGFMSVTGILPALTGTLILNGSVDFGTPQHTANAGSDCISLATSSNLYLGKVSDLTSGATTWPSLIPANTNGPVNQFIASPSPLTANFSSTLDRFVFVTNSVVFVKQLVNNSYDAVVGGTKATLLTAVPTINPPYGLSTVACMDVKNGVLACASSAIGQIGVLLVDLRASSFMDYSYVISKVISTAQMQWMAVKIENDYPNTANSLKIYYRTTGFGSATGNWIALNDEGDMSQIASSAQVQFKFAFYIDGDCSGQFPQMGKAYLVTQPLSEISDNWVGSNDNTVSSSPARSAFRLINPYASSVPTLFFRAYDDNGVLVASANTAANPTLFEYSTNNGTSWNALGTIPNTALTTEVGYKWASPPGVRVSVSLREA